MQFRDLPSVDRVMASDGMAALTETYPRDWVVDLVRRELDRARQQIRDGGKAPSAGDVADGVGGELRSINEVAPRQVINATGVIVHTNLGRAPLSQSAIDAMTQAARGYTDLEMDLSTGRRGSRQAHLQSLLQQVTGAEAALAVNNNASACFWVCRLCRWARRSSSPGAKLWRLEGASESRTFSSKAALPWWTWAPPTGPISGITKTRSRIIPRPC